MNKNIPIQYGFHAIVTPCNLQMAGEDFIKSSPRSISGSSKGQKPKQASILSFFNLSQKSSSQVTASPLSQASTIVAPQEDTSMSDSFLADSSMLMEEFSPVDEVEFLEAATFNPTSEPVKKVKVEVDFSSLIKSSAEKGIVAPRILADLNQVANNFDIEHGDAASAGRYSWLIDVKDAQGRSKGNIKI